MGTTTLRLPEDLERDLQTLAGHHERSVHGEMLHALKQYVLREKKIARDIDTLYSRSPLYLWYVFFEGKKIAEVEADSADHACDWICSTRWLSRLKLSAVGAGMNAEPVDQSFK